MKILYSKFALVGLLWFVSCKSTNIEPYTPSPSESVLNECISPDDTQAVTLFLARMNNAAPAARTTQEQEADYYNNLGVAQDLTGNYAQAIEYHTHALHLRQALSNQADVPKSYNNLAIVQYAKGDYQEAFKLYAKAIELFHNSSASQWEAHTLRNYALALQAQQLYGDARQKLTDALHIWEALGNVTQVVLLQQDLASLPTGARILGEMAIRNEMMMMESGPGSNGEIRFIEVAN